MSHTCRPVAALLLAPVLGFCMLLEVTAGTGSAWGSLQPGHTNLAWALTGFLFAGFVPGVVMVTTVRSRHRAHGGGIVNRALRIECWGLTFGLPIAALSLLVVAAGVLSRHLSNPVAFSVGVTASHLPHIAGTECLPPEFRCYFKLSAAPPAPPKSLPPATRLDVG